MIFPAGQRNRFSLPSPSPLNPLLSPVQPGPRVLCFLIPCPLSGARGFPGSSAGKEFICNAGDPGLIPGLGRSPGEGLGYPLQHSWASLVTQLVKNLPAMWETWVQSLGWEDPLEKGKATHSSILAWRIPWTVWSTGSQRFGHD